MWQMIGDVVKIKYLIKCLLKVYLLMMISLPSTAGMCSEVFSDLHLKLDLPLRIVRLLYKERIYTVEQLKSKTSLELLRVSGFGKDSLKTVEEALLRKGLLLRASLRSLNPNDISVLNLSTRSQNALRFEGINNIEELTSRTPKRLLGIPNLGQGSLIEIERALNKKALSLRASPKSLEADDISVLNLSAQSENALRAEGIHTVKQLVSKIPKDLLKNIFEER